MPPDRRSGPRQPAGAAQDSGTTQSPGATVHDPADDEGWRERPVLAAESVRLTRYLAALYPADHDPESEREWCDGAHHPGRPCDYWGVCSGAAYTYREHRALRKAVTA